jgi:hypothetical protein
MTELVLTMEEASQIKGSNEAVVVKGPDGEMLGFFMPPRIPDEFDRAIIERIKADRDKPKVYVTYEHVKERLRQLEAGECTGE